MATALETAALSYAASIGWGAGGAGAVVWPAPVNCIAGPKPASVPSMIASEQDLAYFATRNAYFDRMHPGVPDGAVLLVGDSHIEALPAPAVCPFAVNMGIGGDTLRGLLNRLDRPTSLSNAFKRAGAGVLLIGVNDVCWEGGNYFVNCTYMLDMLANWLTGRWVICRLLPINEGMFQGTTNARLDVINGAIAQRFAGRQGFAVLDMKPSLAPQGQLLQQFTADGLHLNAAGASLLIQSMSAALRDLGVSW